MFVVNIVVVVVIVVTYQLLIIQQFLKVVTVDMYVYNIYINYNYYFNNINNNNNNNNDKKQNNSLADLQIKFLINQSDNFQQLK